MTVSELMQAMAKAGAPMEAIVIAVQALEAKDAEIAARDAAAAAKRAEHAAWKRENRKGKRTEADVSMDSPRTEHGQEMDSSPEVSPNDIYSNPLPNPSNTLAALAERVVVAWNDGPGKNGATGAKPLDAGRRKALAARLKEHTEDEVFAAIANLGNSPWHCGKGQGGWKANIGWMLKSAENFQKALELEPAPRSSAPPHDLVQMILRRKHQAEQSSQASAA